MANSEHLDVLKQGVRAWNNRRSQNLFNPDLTEADLSGVDLSGADLRGANLVSVNLTGADLTNGDLRLANLTAAKLDGVNLMAANFHGAALIGADLSGTNLIAANLCHVDIRTANLANALLGRTLLADVDLSSVTGLDAVRHHAPSSIGIDTVLLSGGNIPEVFLRGAGVSDQFITYIKSLVGLAIEFYSCFISYSTKDQEFAERLYADLQAKEFAGRFLPLLNALECSGISWVIYRMDPD